MVKPKARKAQDFRLPDGVAPLRYDVVIFPHLETRSFEGAEAIDLVVQTPTSSITLNTKKVAIHCAIVIDNTGTAIIGAVKSDDERELTEITFAGTLAPGAWKLYLRFSGSINDNLKGIYRSTWKDAQGEHELVATQFCATDARRAFPCFDEPEKKATFKLSLIVDHDQTALSNCRQLVEERIKDGGDVKIYHGVGLSTSFGPLFRKKRVEFEETMVMSSYLPAFVVGKLVSSRQISVNGTAIKVWSVPGKEHLTEFALSCAQHALAWYENYFALPYPGGSKVDLVALPDLAYGAMENLGCITFREQALLVDPQTASVSELVRVASTVMHELAHMWFGDLVTMRWWNGIWLNEAFATFMEHLCLDAWKPEWRVWDEFALGRAAAARIDSLASTHPIESPVHHPDEASELFDVISYEKGCSVLYQLHEFMGAEVFRQGIIDYLTQHMFCNTETHELWDSLEFAARMSGQASLVNLPVRSMMDAWVFTPGHPLIAVTKSKLDGCITVSQRRFSLLPADDPNTLLPVPLIIRVHEASGKTRTIKVLLTAGKKSIFVGESARAVVVNAGGAGFYRVTYGQELLAPLMKKPMEMLSAVERFNLLNDAWYGLLAGQFPVSAYIGLVKRFGSETEPAVWRVMSSSLARLKDLAPAKAKRSVEELIVGLVAPVVARLGWSAQAGGSTQSRQLRGIAIRLLGENSQEPQVLVEARKVLAAWKTNPSSVDAEVFSSCVAIVANQGGDADYEEFQTLATSHASAQVRDRFLEELSRFQKPELLARTVEKIRSGQIKGQDAAALFSRLMASAGSARTCWALLKDEFDGMSKRLPEPVMIKFCRSVAELDVEELESEVTSFLATREFKAGRMAIAQSLELFKVKVKMRKREAPALANALLAGV